MTRRASLVSVRAASTAMAGVDKGCPSFRTTRKSLDYVDPPGSSTGLARSGRVQMPNGSSFGLGAGGSGGGTVGTGTGGGAAEGAGAGVSAVARLFTRGAGALRGAGAIGAVLDAGRFSFATGPRSGAGALRGALSRTAGATGGGAAGGGAAGAMGSGSTAFGATALAFALGGDTSRSSSS